MKNEMSVQFSSISENESFARVTIAAFLQSLNPTMDELTEIKTVVSEAVTNAIIHGYESNPSKMIYLSCCIQEGANVIITIRDYGCGISDLETAKEPLYTSKPELERSGMGFTIMESFMDSLMVESALGQGTTVIMKKQLVSVNTVCF